LAFNQFLWAIAWKWREVTGGDDGIGRIVPRKPVDLGILSLDLMNMETKYYLMITIVVGCLAFGWYLMRTPFGNTITAIKVNEERASFLGYNVNRAKLLMFSFAAFYAAIAGSLFAVFQDFVATSSIDLGMSTQVLFMAFLGGTVLFHESILPVLSRQGNRSQALGLSENAYPFDRPESMIYTSCLQCNTGCGIKVKIQDGVAIKIDSGRSNCTWKRNATLSRQSRTRRQASPPAPSAVTITRSMSPGELC